ncbi:MAG TPA: hypothetical protein VKZ60_09740 [Chloroflexota bacterium]|jgi:Mrp family chromosome partitioning ATPase/capsular polysaccharide biosynthesis protein|nr:hypothetical protein [Chloroflexota bacterium]
MAMYVQALLRYWWLLVIVPLVGVAVAYYSSATARSQYQSVVTLQLNPAARSAFLPYSTENNEITVLAASYGEVLRSRAFAEAVVARLNLPLAPEALAHSISTALVPNTNILRLTVTRDHPADAQWLAQSIAEIFTTETVQSHALSTGVPSRLAEMEEMARGYPARIAALRQQRDRLDQAVARGDLSRLTELNGLENRLAALEASHANLLVEINRARSSLNTASILDGASPAVRSSGLPLGRTLPFGFLSGVAIAVALVLGLARLDNRIRGPWDIQAGTGAPPLVCVAAAKGGRARGHGEVVLIAPEDRAAEPFRMLRADLYATRGEHPCRVIVVTSPQAGEGKTFVACNLAMTCARAGERVLLVDGHLRRPCLDQLFAHGNGHAPVHGREIIPAAAPRPTPQPHGAEAGGVATAVEAPPIAGVVPSGHDNLWLLPAGPAVVDTAPVLAQLLPRLREYWDLVIVDSAPVLPVADTRLLVVNADAVLIIARRGRTTQAALAECLAVVRKASQAVVGVVLDNYR